MISEHNYSSKNDFETRRENQDFERQNISMSQPPLDSTPFGTNTTNVKNHQLNRFLSVQNTRTYVTETTNGIPNTTNVLIRAKEKSARTSGPGSRPIIIRLIIKRV